MKNADIARWRMHRQHLWGAPLETSLDVVRYLGAVQSQEYLVAKWSIAQRAKGGTDAVVERALTDGSLLRTHVLRPTWHFVLPADIRWMLALTAPRIRPMMAYYDRQLELDERLLAKSQTVIAKALKGGRQFTRTELSARLERSGIPATGQRLGHILAHAELAAVICSGARKGKHHTYALFDERVPKAETVDADSALAELARRFFIARGPATIKDFMRWSSLTAKDGKSGLEMVRSQLEHETIDGRTYWFAPSSPGPKPSSPVIDLVQGYDECISSYGETKDVLYAGRAKPPTATERPVFTHVVLLDGQLVGHWRPVPTKNAVTVETVLYERLARAEVRALTAAAARYGQFLEMPATLLRSAS